MFSIKLAVEKKVLDNGVAQLKTWVDTYEGFKEPHIFVMKENYNQFNKLVTPQFMTIATAANMVEYPINKPETKGGIYRDTKLYLEFDNEDSLNYGLDVINYRINKLTQNMTHIMNTDLFTEESRVINGHNVVIKYSQGFPKFNQRVIITLDEGDNILLMRKTDNLGDLFLNVCREQDMVKFGEEPTDTESRYRSNKVDLVTYTSLVQPLINKFCELVKRV